MISIKEFQIVKSMFYFILIKSIPEDLLNRNVKIVDHNNQNMSISQNNGEFKIGGSGNDVITISGNEKEYDINVNGTRMCVNKEKDLLLPCSNKHAKDKKWNIKPLDGGYYIKPVSKSVFSSRFNQLCLTNSKGKLKIKKCSKPDYKNQIFDILPHENKFNKQPEKENEPKTKDESSSSSSESKPPANQHSHKGYDNKNNQSNQTYYGYSYPYDSQSAQSYYYQQPQSYYSYQSSTTQQPSSYSSNISCYDNQTGARVS